MLTKSLGKNKTIKNTNTTTHKSTIIIYVCFYA